MEQNHDKYSKTVFRLRGLPNTVDTMDDVARLVNESLGDIPADRIRVFSLATTLNSWENPPSKVATIMFATAPSVVRDGFGEDEWYIPARNLHSNSDLILDTHFMGMTPLNDVEPLCHLCE